MTSATQELPARVATEKPHARTTHLPGVDGIRALAVSAVVIYHLNSDWLPGGYLGVDVFFVVSGYLITRLLVAERGDTVEIGLQNFWVRRARRILPPLFPMLLVTIVGSALIDRSVLHNLRTEVVGALTYTSNWVQISQHHSYFASFDQPSSLQHLWSLAVEEQFYLVWPLVVAAALWWRGRRHLAMLAGLGALASATAMAALYQPGVDPSHLYYSTLTHSAGLLVGAVLAIAWPATNAPSTPRAIKTGAALSVLGVVGIGIGFWLLDERGGAPYQGGILAVSLASALLIVGAGHGRTTIGRLLAHPLVRWLGARSYGLYLWHWPVLVLGARLFGHRSLLVVIAEVVISLLLAAASYRWIERPVQRYGYRGAYVLAKGSVRSGGKGVHHLAMFGAAALTAACLFAAISLMKAPPPPSNALEDQLASAQLAVERAPLTTPQPPGEALAKPMAAGASAPCPSSPPPGDQITALGDSVMLAASPSLLAALPGIQIDAQTNRSMQAGSDILAARVRDGSLRPVVVLGLGTNGEFPRAMLDRVIDQLGPTRTVYLVNLYLPTKPYTSEINDTLAAVAKARPNVHLADWQAVAAGHLDALYSDGIHPKPGPGSDLYANMVVSLMSGLPCSKPNRMSRPVSMASAAVPAPGSGPPALADRTYAASDPEPNAAQPTALEILEDVGTFRVPMSIVLVMLLVPVFIRIRQDETFKSGLGADGQ